MTYFEQVVESVADNVADMSETSQIYLDMSR